MKPSRNIIGIASAVVVIAVILMLIFRPLRASIAHHRGQISSKRSEVTDAMTLVGEFPDLLQRRGEVDAYVANNASILPSSDKVPGILGDVTALAASSNLKIRSFTPKPRVDSKIIGQTHLNMTATGEFSQLHDFVEKLEQLKPGIWVRRIQIDRQNKTSTVVSQINLVIFSSENDIADLTAH
jgi:Tfp pilus assembly protein PilO